jgi:hypothetical protein
MTVEAQTGGGFGRSKSGPTDVEEFVGAVTATLGDKLAAIYSFGSGFARGPKGPRARLLVLVTEINAAVLAEMSALTPKAREASFQIRLDTANDVICCADVFPVFVLELLDTKELLAGQEVLQSLQVRPEHLRRRVEQSLRMLHRDLIRGYLDATGDGALAHQLRLNVRKSVYLLRALALVCKLELPDPPTVEAAVDVVVSKLLSDKDVSVWHRMRKFAGFEEVLEHDDLVVLYGDALSAFSALVDAVDKLED